MFLSRHRASRIWLYRGSLRRRSLKKGCQAAKQKSGACRSEGSLRVSMYPDRLAETPREVDLSDPGAALATEAALGLLAAPAVDRTRTRGDRCLHQPPAQIAGAVLGQRGRGGHSGLTA